jgi:hypothetical protein
VIAQPIWIHALSARSIYVEAISPGGSRLSSATAFLVKNREDHLFLVTNRHVVTGRHQETGELLSATGATPERLAIAFQVRQLGPGMGTRVSLRMLMAARFGWSIRIWGHELTLSRGQCMVR